MVKTGKVYADTVWSMDTLYETDTWYMSSFLCDYTDFMESMGIYVPPEIYIQHWTCVPPDYFPVIHVNEEFYIKNIGKVIAETGGFETFETCSGACIVNRMVYACTTVTDRTQFIKAQGGELYFQREPERYVNELLSQGKAITDMPHNRGSFSPCIITKDSVTVVQKNRKE